MPLFKSPAIEGPGISKNAAEKRGFIKFFEQLKCNYWKLLFSGLLSSLFGLFIIPYGLGAVGAARMARLAVRDRHAFNSDYFDAIKENWKQALTMGIINNLLLGLMAFITYYLYNAQQDGVNFAVLGISGAALIIVNFIRYYTPAIILTFNVTLGQLYKNALVLSFAGIVRNFAIMLIHLLTYAIVLSPMLLDLYIGAGISICLWLLVVPPVHYYTTQYHIYPVMFKYMIEPFMKNHPGEGEKTLRELGLIGGDQDPIMEDLL